MSQLLLQEEPRVRLGIDGLGGRLRLRLDLDVFEHPELLNPAFHDHALLTHTQVVKHLIREAQFSVEMCRKPSGRFNLRRVFYASVVEFPLVGHVR